MNLINTSKLKSLRWIHWSIIAYIIELQKIHFMLFIYSFPLNADISSKYPISHYTIAMMHLIDEVVLCVCVLINCRRTKINISFIFKADIFLLFWCISSYLHVFIWMLQFCHRRKLREFFWSKLHCLLQLHLLYIYLIYQIDGNCCKSFRLK